MNCTHQCCHVDQSLDDTLSVNVLVNMSFIGSKRYVCTIMVIYQPIKRCDFKFISFYRLLCHKFKFEISKLLCDLLSVYCLSSRESNKWHSCGFVVASPRRYLVHLYIIIESTVSLRRRLMLNQPLDEHDMVSPLKP